MQLEGIKNIIFDLGGVILNLDFGLTKQAFENLGIQNFDDHYSKAKQTGIFDKFEKGLINEEEFCEMLRQQTQIIASNNEIVSAWNAMLLDFPPIRKTLLLNVGKKYNITLLSNTNETHVRAFEKTIKEQVDLNSMGDIFPTFYYSNEIGLRKPDAEAFEYVLKENNFKANETLFLDDSIQHIEGAQQCGINTHHIADEPIEELFANFLA